MKRLMWILVLGACGGTAISESPTTLQTTTSITALPTTTTTIPLPTTTTTVVTLREIADALDIWKAFERAEHGTCGEWHDLALQNGWPEAEWPRLRYVIWRESRCLPFAWNGWDAGLTQINQIHTEWLNSMGLSHPDDMFDPALNLRFAYQLWTTSGWKPWSFEDDFVPSK